MIDLLADLADSIGGASNGEVIESLNLLRDKGVILPLGATWADGIWLVQERKAVW